MRFGIFLQLCAITAAWNLAHAFGDSPRTLESFNDDWKFYPGDATNVPADDFDASNWKSVTTPHTWNTKSDPPKKDYYRGPGWYRKTFVANEEWKGKRVFIRFEAASLVAQVYLNGSELGEHKGGFAAFCYELTPLLRLGETNLLAVRVDNSRREDVIPLGGDFTIFGGLYRPVSLIITGPVDITPLDYGSPGVFLRQLSVTDSNADVEIETEVSNGDTDSRRVTVQVDILDKDGGTICKSTKEQQIKARHILIVTQRTSIKKPHLWNGVDDPYMYTARIKVLGDGKVLDGLDQPLGLRYFREDPKLGFVLNGKPRQIHGVARHQDWAGTGWAISDQQQDEDMKIMREMGVTGVRLAHYQDSDYFYQLCDRNGLLVWAELCMVNEVRGTPAFLENARQQLQELIRQNFNHPSIVMWSLYNEISPGNTNNPAPIVRNLKELAKKEDASRPTTGALAIDGIQKLHGVGKLNDILALNVYPGWYIGVPDDMGPIIDKWNGAYGTNGIIISEYGAGANIAQHAQDFTGRTGRAPKDWHPEEWQSVVHERNYAAIKARPYVYGSFVWNMFDFASASRNEGGIPGINDKGLVTRDRKIKKDAYYFYQANWTTNPMVYICSRRFTDRTNSVTDVKVYSNCPKVALTINGRSRGEMEGDSLNIFTWKNVILQPGDNEVKAEADSPNGTMDDVCRWTYQPPTITTR